MTSYVPLLHFEQQYQYHSSHLLYDTPLLQPPPPPQTNNKFNLYNTKKILTKKTQTVGLFLQNFFVKITP